MTTFAIKIIRLTIDNISEDIAYETTFYVVCSTSKAQVIKHFTDISKGTKRNEEVEKYLRKCRREGESLDPNLRHMTHEYVEGAYLYIQVHPLTARTAYRTGPQNDLEPKFREKGQWI